jgi:hypothetical protein
MINSRQSTSKAASTPRLRVDVALCLLCVHVKNASGSTRRLEARLFSPVWIWTWPYWPPTKHRIIYCCDGSVQAR